MRPEDIHEYMAAKRIEAKGDATHVLLSAAPLSLKIGDGTADQEQLARFVYEANRLKDPLPLREFLTPTFSLHFNLEIKGGADKHMKEVAGAIGKGLLEYYPNIDEFACVIYACNLAEINVYKGQVVFPDISVDVQRARQLRAALVDSLTQNQTGLVAQCAALNAANNFASMIRELDVTNGVEVPLAATTRAQGGVTEAALNPLACAKITKHAVRPVPPPEDRWTWVLLGLKRRNMSEGESSALSHWIPPRQFRKGVGGDGSSVKSGGGSKDKDKGMAQGPHTTYSQGAEKCGK
jgi:hypothetical protein